ncbi:LamG-like jellyroll fold domain-containing protein [Actinoplanes sp. G11-F43]|uniref:LamG-like jellyroll fold domain-containing protein n=1 Tax=Actinoplanes sp. G11-F43 TaxID=3424130 RepID=UPI003D3345F4
MRRRIAVVTALTVGLSLGVPPEVIPEDGGWPVSGLLSILRQGPALADVAGVPVQEVFGDPAAAGHYVPSAETGGDTGAGQKAGRRAGVDDPVTPELPESKPFTTAPKQGDENSFDEELSERLPEKSTATSTAYENQDGSFTRRIHESRVNFNAGDGSYEPIDPTLTKRGDRLEAGANSIEVTLGAQAAAPASAARGARLTSAGATSLASVTTASGQTLSWGLSGAAPVRAVVDGQTATYPDVLPFTDLEMHSVNDGLKETLILKSPAAGNEWVFPLRTDGLTPRLTSGGSIELVTAGGEVAMRVPRGWMEDSKVDPQSGAPAESDAVRYELVTVDGGQALKVTADAAWLNDPARQYPIRVDPSVQTKDTGDIFTDNSTSTTNHNGDDLVVGTWDGGTTRSRSFMHFDEFDDDGLMGTQIKSAKLSMWHSWSYNCTNTMPVYVRRITSDWRVQTILDAKGTLASGPSYSAPIGTWVIGNNKPACENTGSNPDKGARRAVKLPVDTFQAWSTKKWPNYGLALTASETNSAGFKRFTSANRTATTDPYLELTYDDNAEPQVNEQYPAYGATTATLTPELIADATDPDNWPKSLTYQFVIYDKDGKTVIKDSGQPSAQTSWTVPPGVLKWNETYYWTVRLDDGLLTNDKYLIKNALSTPVPQQPITSGLSQNSDQGFDPVIGNYTTTARDAMVGTVGPPLEIVRSYNSTDHRTDQAFGAGWSSVLDARITEKPVAISGRTVLNTLVVTYPSGRELAFGRNDDGSWSSPAGQATTLIPITSGTNRGYRLTEKDGTAHEFLGAATDITMPLVSITDGGGRIQKIHHTGGRPSMIEAASGRTLDIEWTTTTPARVARVITDPAVAGDATSVNTWNYQYTGGSLTKVCPPGGGTKCHEYTYGASGSLYQNAVIDARPHSYWRLNETSGGQAESSTVGNGGTDVGTYSGVNLGVPGPLAGTTSTAAGFDGSTSQVQLPAKMSGDWSNQAISMWFKADGADTGVLYGQSQEKPGSTAGNTQTVYNPTLYVGSNGHLMGGFPKALKRDTPTTLTLTSDGDCLTSDGDDSFYTDTCTGANSQLFTWTGAGQIKVTSGGVTRCLQAAETDTDVVAPAVLATTSCSTNDEAQSWDVRANGQIVNNETYQCMQVGYLPSFPFPGGISPGLATATTALAADDDDLAEPPVNYMPSVHTEACATSAPRASQTFVSRVHTALDSGVSVRDGEWHHVLLSASGNKQELYLDGDQVDDEAGIVVQDMTAQSSYIGKGFVGGGWPNQPHPNTTSNKGVRDYFTGVVAEAALFDNSLNAATARYLAEAGEHPAVPLLTAVTKPSGKSGAKISYDSRSSRVTQVTDGNGAVWTPKAPDIAKTTKVYESAVLGGAPTNYWRLAENSGGGKIPVNEVNGQDAAYNVVGLGAVNGPFGDAGKAGTFNGTTSYLSLPPGVAPPSAADATKAGTTSISLWFNTTAARQPLLGPKYESILSTTRYEFPTLWITTDGKLRGLAPNSVPTGPINSIGSKGKCIDLAGDSSANGTKVELRTCDGSAAQNWSVVPANGLGTSFTLQAFGKCITPAGNGTANGTELTLSTCNNSPAQQWQGDSGGFRNQNSLSCLDNPNTSTTDGTVLKLFDCNASTAQTWLPSLASKGKVNDGKWHHAVLTTDGTTQSLYVDGELAQSSTSHQRLGVYNQELKFTLGAGYAERASGNFFYLDHDVTSYFKGSIAEVATYHSVIDASQASYQFRARDAASGKSAGEVSYAIEGPDGATTRVVNDLIHGRKVADVDARGNVTRYGYSGKGNLRSVTDANGNMTVNEHDERGNVVSVTTCQDRSAGNCSTSYNSYWLDKDVPADVRNDKLTAQRGTGSTSITDNRYLTSYEYDTAGNRTSEVDPLGRTTRISYTRTGSPDGAADGVATKPGLPWRVVKPDGGVQTILYSPNGDIAKTIDPAGAATEFTYDGLGRTITETEAADTANGIGKAVTSYTHDRLDRVVTVRTPAFTNAVTSAKHSPLTTLTYDDDGLLLSETVADSVAGGDAARTVTYGYDANGMRVTETDQNNNITRLRYDGYGRVVRQEHPDGTAVVTRFDAAGNELATIIDDGEREITVRSLAYDPAGRLASETDASGARNEYTYTDNNLLLTVTRTDGTNSHVLERNTYNPAGKVISQVTNNGKTRTDYTYDAAGRNTTATVDVNGTARTTSFGYSVDDDVVNTRLNSGGVLLSESDSMYDRLGRLQQQTTYLSSAVTPTARWKLDETSGTTAADATGNNHATVSGAVTWSAGSASFTGAAGAITGQPAVDAQRPYTISALAKLGAGADSADRPVVTLGGDIGGPALTVFYHAQSKSWQMRMAVREITDGSATVLPATPPATVAAGTGWEHLAVVVDPASRTAQLYVNGTVRSTLSTAKPFNNRATDLTIGGGFAGQIDDVRTYQRALTAAQITDIRTGVQPAADAQVSRTTYRLLADGSVAAVTDPKGNTTTIEYDEVGRPVTTMLPPVKPEGGSIPMPSFTRVGYNTFGEVTEQQDRNGQVSVNEYDAVGRMVKSKSPTYRTPDGEDLTATKQIEYNAVGQILKTTDPYGAETSYEYDTLGRTTKVVTPDDGVSAYTYADNGDLLSYTDPQGATVSTTYDYLGRTKDSTASVRQDNKTHVTTYGYGDEPWPTSITSPSGLVTKATYNSVGEQLTVVDGADNTTTTEYDGAGRPVKVIAADKSYSTVTYDFAGRTVSSSEFGPGGTGGALRTRTQTYDIAGNPVRASNAYSTVADKRETEFVYDALGQLTDQYEPVNSQRKIHTRFGYDKGGNRVRFTDGNGNDFLTTYNTWGLPEAQIEPATASTPGAADRTFTSTYDVGGRMVRMDSPGGVTVTSSYDVMGRVTTSSGTGAQVATADREYTYDRAGRMTSFTGAAGRNEIAYDDRGLVRSITGVSGNSSYTYNSDGALATRSDAAGTTTYGYDKGRLSTLTNGTTSLAYKYNELNQVREITYGGSKTRTFGYNPLHQLTSDEVKSAGASVGRIAYVWNVDDTLAQKTTTGFNGASTNKYSYDWAGRLTQWDNGTDPVLYAYDDSGNRVQAGNTVFTYDQRNQLVSDTTGATYEYTARGTLSSTVSGGQRVDTVTDAFNQVISQGSSRYSYDGLGRVIQPNFTYTGLGNDLATDGVNKYVRDTSDQLVGVTSGSNQRYAWTDIHTDVVGEFTATGTALTGSVTYDPWGKVLASGGMVGKLGYQQEWTDQTTGKVNMWSRWYDPATGTFDTRDTANNSPTPTSGSANRFAYAEGNPVTNTDTTGNAVDGKCGTYDYACELRKYQKALDLYNQAMETRDREMKATGAEIARQEAEYQRAERESRTDLLSILLQVGVGMLLDMIGYYSVMGCLQGSLMDCVDLAMNFAGPIKGIKMFATFVKSINRALDGYRTWRRIVDAATTAMRQSQALLGQARKHLADVMSKVPKRPKPPKKKTKPPAKKVEERKKQQAQKQRAQARTERKPAPAQQAKKPAPQTRPKSQDKPTNAKPRETKTQNSQQPRRSAQEQRTQAVELGSDQVTEVGCPIPPPKHSFDPDTRVLMADGTTRRIADISIGDKVAAKDPVTGEEGAREVTLLHANRDYELTDVTVSTKPATDDDAETVSEGRGGRSTRGPTEEPDSSTVLETTAHHPFWDETTDEWVNAADLVAGESTLIGPNGELQYVTKVRNFTGAEVMRDLTVDDIHTYYVIADATSVLVHNNNGDYPCPSDEQLLADARALHQEYASHLTDPEVMAGYTDEEKEKAWASRRKAERKITVVTAVIGGDKFFTVSSNKSSPRMRKLAEELGYQRVSGKRLLGIDPKQTHAEHILLNAMNKGEISGTGRLTPHRKPCEPGTPSYQGCAVRVAGHEGVDLVGWG